MTTDTVSRGTFDGLRTTTVRFDEHTWAKLERLVQADGSRSKAHVIRRLIVAADEPDPASEATVKPE